MAIGFKYSRVNTLLQCCYQGFWIIIRQNNFLALGIREMALVNVRKVIIK